MVEHPISRTSAEANSAEFATPSGIPINDVYRPDSMSDWCYQDKLGDPGQFPFTRGPYTNMYRGRPWTRRQVVGLGTAIDTNERNKFVISQGQTGISNDYDVPTLIGIDSDDPRATGEVGRTGVAIDTVRDMEDLFEGIDLGGISVSMTINHPALVVVAQFAAAAQRRGFGIDQLAGTVQNDPLKDFYAQKTYIFPPAPSVRFAGDLIEYCTKNMPRCNGISLNGYNIREAGTTADQELGFTFAHAIAYIEDLLGRGLDIDSFAPRFSFIFNVHNDFLEEVAKLRAARRMWAHLLHERFGAKDPRSMRLRTHVQTGGSTMTYQQPEVNLIRGAVQSLAGALGGTQSMAVSCFDEAYSIPSEKAQRLALRTQQVIAHESGVADVVDPLAGSYFVESLTDQIEGRAHGWINEIDNRGGAAVCVESGWLEQVVSDTAHSQQAEILDKRRVIVGVNQYADGDDSGNIETFRVDDQAEIEQLGRLRAVKDSRDEHAVQRSLEQVQLTAAKQRNVMPVVLDAVQNLATQGEIISRLIDVVGEYKAPAIY